ncbi:MAG: PEP-CTERM sorting domain-containing protein [Rhodocyclales bacterium GT-UBC]|nr:MAG: PEP-CTERM sorting domain-containing protein [Rhodocyclales bacterium GT-UBC]
MNIKSVLATLAMVTSVIGSAQAATVGGSAASLYSNTGPGLTFTQTVNFLPPVGSVTGGSLSITFNGDFYTGMGEDFQIVVDGVDFGVVGNGNPLDDRFTNASDNFDHDTTATITASIMDSELASMLSDGSVSLFFADIAATGDWIDWVNTFDWQINYTESTQSVPEPATLLLFGAALAGIGAGRKRNRA